MAEHPLPDEIIHAIGNAESTGEQPAVLANLALAQRIFNQNMRQQTAIAHEQAMNQIRLAAVAKAVSLIDGSENREQLDKIVEQMGELMNKLHPLDIGESDPTSAQPASDPSAA